MLVVRLSVTPESPPPTARLTKAMTAIPRAGFCGFPAIPAPSVPWPNTYSQYKVSFHSVFVYSRCAPGISRRICHTFLTYVTSLPISATRSRGQAHRGFLCMQHFHPPLLQIFPSPLPTSLPFPFPFRGSASLETAALLQIW